MSDRLIESKLANALFADAKGNFELVGQIADAADKLGVTGAGMAAKTLPATMARFAKAYGGLWVGGRVTLYDDMLKFEPNAMNRMLHENGATLRMDIPLGSIDTVTLRFAMFTSIIDIVVEGAQFSVRCYGAKSFAERIRQAIARPPVGLGGN